MVLSFIKKLCVEQKKSKPETGDLAAVTKAVGVGVCDHSMKDSTSKRTAAQVIGGTAEQLAADYLELRGLKILARNFRVRGGELDLVAKDQQTVVFVEVRFRRNVRFGGASESISRKKRLRIILAAELFLLRQPELRESPCRFDCIFLDALQPDAIEWIQDAFRVE